MLATYTTLHSSYHIGEPSLIPKLLLPCVYHTISGVARIFFLLRQGTTVRSCLARAKCGNLLLGIVTLLTSGTERAIVSVLPSSLLAASCHHDFRHVCGFYVRPRPHDSKISYKAVASVAFNNGSYASDYDYAVLLLISVLHALINATCAGMRLY